MLFLHSLATLQSRVPPKFLVVVMSQCRRVELVTDGSSPAAEDIVCSKHTRICYSFLSFFLSSFLASHPSIYVQNQVPYGRARAQRGVSLAPNGENHRDPARSHGHIKSQGYTRRLV